MTDEELINQLRQTGHRVAVPCPDGIKGCAVFHYRFETEPTCAAAAVRIESLLAENAELKKELRQLERDTMEHRHDR